MRHFGMSEAISGNRDSEFITIGMSETIPGNRDAALCISAKLVQRGKKGLGQDKRQTIILNLIKIRTIYYFRIQQQRPRSIFDNTLPHDSFTENKKLTKKERKKFVSAMKFTFSLK